MRVQMDGSVAESKSTQDDDIEKQIEDLAQEDDGCPPNGFPRPVGAKEEEEMAKKAKLNRSVSSIDTVSETEYDDMNKRINRGQLHRITNVNAYAGSTLGEKMDTIIKSHPVVMIDRTWCLFSVDAQNLLLQQMRVPVHSIEVDVHPQGSEIFKYVKEKTKHYTTPCIFIRGKFLGGFREVNTLYAEGKLQELYLKDLTQADECEAVLAAARYKTTPFFLFPEKVDGNVVRITGVLTCFASAICAFLVHYLFWARYIAYALAVDFVLRLLGGAKVSCFGRISMLVAYYLEPIPRHGRPKQFATCCGIAFSGLASLAFLVSFPGHDIVGSVFMSILAFAAGMEGFLDFCVGCLVFRLCVKLGIFRGTS